MILRIEPNESEKKRGMLRPFRQAFIHTPCAAAHMWTIDEAVGHARRIQARLLQRCKFCKKEFPLDQFIFQVRGEKGEIYHESMLRWENSVHTLKLK